MLHPKPAGASRGRAGFRASESTGRVCAAATMRAMTRAVRDPNGMDAAALAAAVEERELLRLLGMPRSRPLKGDLRAAADAARAWYAAHGRPYVAARRVDVLDAAEDAGVRLADG